MSVSIKLYLAIFIYLSCSVMGLRSSGSILPSADPKKVHEQLVSYRGIKTFIFSFPGSGNTWIRYCLEYLTGRPSFARINRKMHPVDLPLGFMVPFPLDFDKPPLEKAHSVQDIKLSNGSVNRDYLIFILRNPKEVFVRNRKPEDITKLLISGMFNAPMRSYFDDIRIYHDWCADKKILIYYEDLIKYPETTLATLLDFIKEPNALLEEFIQNYAQHKKTALAIKEILSPNFTNGQEAIYHSARLNKEDRIKIDSIIKKIYPNEWKNYLEERYEER